MVQGSSDYHGTSIMINFMKKKKTHLIIIQSFCSCPQKLKDVEPIIWIEEVDGSELAQEFSDEIEKMLGSKMKSVKVSMSTGVSKMQIMILNHKYKKQKSTLPQMTN